MTSRPAVFVRIEDHDGCFGWGEIFSNWPVAGAEHRARLLMEDVADLVLGTSVGVPEELFGKLEAATRIPALQCGEPGPFAQVIAGLDIAIHDLFARRSGLPLHKQLSETAPMSVPVYASGVHVRDGRERRDEFRARGIGAMKVKVGFNAHEDIALVAALLGDLRDGERLFADANQAWDVDESLAFLRGVGDALGWIEEPIRADCPAPDWQRIAAEGGVPVAAGENLCSMAAIEQALEADYLTYYQPDIAKWGGISGGMAVAERIRHANRTCCLHYLGGGIGLAASAACFAAFGGDGLVEVDVNENPLRDAFFEHGPIRDGGTMTLSDAPGLGIEGLPEEIARYKTLCMEKRL